MMAVAMMPADRMVTNLDMVLRSSEELLLLPIFNVPASPPE